VLSGGEKSRVLLGKILAKEANVLFLDEPTNHLDMDSISALTESLVLFPGTVFIVTHSELILNEIPTKFIVFQNDGPIVFEGSYQDFLEKIGWEDEKQDTNQKKNKLSYKEIKDQRAKIVKERSGILNPLKSIVEKIEQEIESLEGKIKVDNDLILKASESGETHKISPLSIQINQAENKIEELFFELEEKSLKLAEESQRFEVLLKALEES
jgi:ATP-binding cassette subfamily F protein 3